MYLNHRKVNVFLSIVFGCHTLAVLETGVGGSGLKNPKWQRKGRVN